jgi:hypothetical protein
MNPQPARLYAVTIDTEEQWDWSAGFPVRSHSLDNIRVLPEFEQLCAGHQARSTWFTNWSVLHDAASRRVMLDLAARPGVEVGMHIHPWLTPPQNLGDEGRVRLSFLHNYPDEIIRAKLQRVHELFEQNGLAPKSFRGGRYSSGGVVHDFLMAKGFTVDCSIVPFSTWPDEGAPDYRACDLTPNRVGPNADRRGFWELPLTLAFTRRDFRHWAKLYELLGSSSPLLRHLRLIGILERLGIVRRVWLNFETESVEAMCALLRVVRRMPIPFVVFTVHSSSLIAKGNPHSASETRVREIWSTADRVLAEVKTWADFRPATVAEIGEALEAQYQRGS